MSAATGVCRGLKNSSRPQMKTLDALATGIVGLGCHLKKIGTGRN